MMNFKRILTCTVLLSLLASIVGCTPSKNSGSDTTSTGVVLTKQLDLDVWQTANTDYVPPEAPKQDVVENWLVQKTKVKIANIFGNGGGQWDTLLGRLVAGNNLPQLLVCGNYQGPAHFAKLAEIDKVWQLTPELLKKYAPNISKRIPQKYWDRIKVDGKIYGIPYLIPTTKENTPQLSDEAIDYYNVNNNDITIDSYSTLWVRDDILKAVYPQAKTYNELLELQKQNPKKISDLLLDTPIKSTQDYVDFLYKVRDMKLTENGKPVYAFGYTGGDNWLALSWLGADMMGYKTHYYTSTWNTDKQTIEVPLVESIVRQAAALQNKMLRDKVIDPESLANTIALYNEKLMNGRYVVAAPSMSGSQINTELEKAGKTYRYRPFYTQVSAQKGYEASREEFMWNESVAILKSVDEKDLPQVLNWMDVQFTDEWDQVQNWGPKEAGLYREEANGKRVFIDPVFNDFFANKKGEIKPADNKGIGTKYSGLYSMSYGLSKWVPDVMYNNFKYGLDGHIAFSNDSPHVTSVKLVPIRQAWSPQFAEIPEVVTYWSKRDQWEQPFKMALSSDTEEQFNKKWNDAIANLNNIVNVKTMTDKMTVIAKKDYEQLMKEKK